MKKFYIDVNGVKKESCDVTYDEMVQLTKNFIDINGYFPNAGEFKISNNLPSSRARYNILKCAEKTYDEFKKDVGYTQEYARNNYFSSKDLDFPLTMADGSIIYLDESLNDINQIKRDSYIHIYDQFGYRYYHNYDRLLQLCMNKGTLSKYSFTNKIYLRYNIDNFLALNKSVYRVYNIDDNSTINDFISIYSTITGEIIDTKLSFILNCVHLFISDRTEHDNNRRFVKELTKEKATKIVYNMQENLDRPLKISDFKGGTTPNHLSHNHMMKFWGSFKNMIKELGSDLVFKINYDCNISSKVTEICEHDATFRNYINMIKRLCSEMLESGSNIISKSDFEKNYINVQFRTIQNYLRTYDFGLQNIVNLYGCRLILERGNLCFMFNDGESILSQYEYDFSKILRDGGYVFNQDYFRDVRYSDICNNYSGFMNCDYLLVHNNKKLYVELAGMLCSNSSEQAFYNNTIIKRNDLEQYRQKLNFKKQMLDSCGVNYCIVVGKNLNHNYFKTLIENFYSD